MPGKKMIARRKKRKRSHRQGILGETMRRLTRAGAKKRQEEDNNAQEKWSIVPGCGIYVADEEE
ncbi:hypothetical protein ACFLZ9_01910 [Patescibacteria group bacterium]